MSYDGVEHKVTILKLFIPSIKLQHAVMRECKGYIAVQIIL